MLGWLGIRAQRNDRDTSPDVGCWIYWRQLAVSKAPQRNGAPSVRERLVRRTGPELHVNRSLLRLLLRGWRRNLGPLKSSSKRFRTVLLCRVVFPLNRSGGNWLPGLVVDSLGRVTLRPDFREPIANAKLDAELFADVGAMIVMLMLVHGRWYVQ